MTDDLDVSADEVRVLYHLARLKQQGWVPVAPEVLYSRVGNTPDPVQMLEGLMERGFVERVVLDAGGSYELTAKGTRALERVTPGA